MEISGKAFCCVFGFFLLWFSLGQKDNLVFQKLKNTFKRNRLGKIQNDTPEIHGFQDLMNFGYLRSFSRM